MISLNRQILKETVDATILADNAEGKVGGVAVSVLQDGEVIYQNCFDDEKNGVYVTENTLYRLASMTKPITAVAVLICVDRGLIGLDDKVSKYIPEFAHMNIGKVVNGELQCAGPAQKEIIIRYLLSHSSGLGSGPVESMLNRKFPLKMRSSLKQAVDFYAQNFLDFEPFSQTNYSGIYAFDVLARIVEIVTDTPYNEFLQKEIFGPLGMEDTTFTPTEEQWERLIPMHTYEDGVGGKNSDFPRRNIIGDAPQTYFIGGGGLVSTLKDYIKFAELLQNFGKVNGKQIVSESLIREMASPQLPDTILRGNQNWGLGVRVITGETYKDLPCGAFGWSGAYGSHFWIDPVNHITAIYMKNSQYDGGAQALTARRFEQDVTKALSNN